MAEEFTGKVALVTGAASGIGRAIALGLAAGGAAVVAADLHADAARAVADTITAAGGRAISVAGDIARPADVAAAVDAAVNTYGALHLAANNAGITGPTGAPADIDIDAYHRVIAVNLDAVFYGLKYQVPAMLAAGGGAIVNTSSVLGLVGTPAALPYVTAKHGVSGMTKAAAAAYARHGIRINSIHPGYIDTPLLSEMPRRHYDALAALHPIGRLGTAGEVADLALFLLSDRASYITGSQHVVDGGYTAV